MDSDAQFYAMSVRNWLQKQYYLQPSDTSNDSVL
jgi:hypothetical protein